MMMINSCVPHEGAQDDGGEGEGVVDDVAQIVHGGNVVGQLLCEKEGMHV